MSPVTSEMQQGDRCTVISRNEFDRIRDSLREATVAESQTRRLDLREKSKSRAKQWTNTLEGSRRKKMENRLMALQAEEKARQVLDEEEAQHQLDARKRIIQRANAILFDESDRIKSFRSKMMLSDVLAEREAQIELKEELQKLELIRDERYLEMDRQNYRKMLERELKEKKDLEDLTADQSQQQRIQREKKAQRKKEEHERNMHEGMLMRQRAIEDLDAENEIQKRHREIQVKELKERQQETKYQLDVKQSETLRAQKEAEKIEEYAVEKERILRLRKAKEKEITHEKIESQNRLIEIQTKKLAEMTSNEDERIHGQVEDKRLREDQVAAKKEANRKEMAEQIDKSRRTQIKRKKEERERNVLEDLEVAEFWCEWTKQLDSDQKADELARRRAAQQLARDQLKQVEMKRRRGREERRLEDKIASRAKVRLDNDALEFHSFAEDVIREYATDGKNVIPMVKELRDFQKRGLE